MRTSAESSRLQRGFSLLEVMVAFAILALSLGVLMQIFSRSMNATALSSDYSRAAAVAEARLNAVGVDIPLVEGVYSGEPEDGIDWVVNIEAFPPPIWAADNPVLQAYLVRAVASWPGTGAGHGRRVELQTLRLGEIN
ncbi:type IV pilus modification PilV family protein [Rhabdochromatium marinum]|uniref:type IV pilus modification PilV family protein n=1 Tax=Rhabdochromatium marinum TaxID=48729 RepID=UPI001905D475|nr:type II secretion system protein [Rhabdochromatium marinum]MBK1647377.1 hypothetical protein [Rhabdochromatium marinum]